jgi:hypothetical protein
MPLTESEVVQLANGVMGGRVINVVEQVGIGGLGEVLAYLDDNFVFEPANSLIRGGLEPLFQVTDRLPQASDIAGLLTNLADTRRQEIANKPDAIRIIGLPNLRLVVNDVFHNLPVDRAMPYAKALESELAGQGLKTQIPILERRR